MRISPIRPAARAGSRARRARHRSGRPAGARRPRAHAHHRPRPVDRRRTERPPPGLLGQCARPAGAPTQHRRLLSLCPRDTASSAYAQPGGLTTASNSSIDPFPSIHYSLENGCPFQLPSPLHCVVRRGKVRARGERSCRCRHREEDPWRKRQKGYEPRPGACSSVLYARAPYGAPMAGVTVRSHLSPEQKVASFSMPIDRPSAASARFRAWLILQA